jgi:acyl carrier protein
MEDNQIFKNIVAVIQKNRGELSKIITPITTLQNDLGIDGIDAEEILNEYFALYNMDISDFYFSNYFGEENFNPITILKSLFSSKKKKPITAGHLVNCATKRKWIIP